MSKNLTRKGLAFGAIVALGTTLFAGAPASAALSEQLTLLPSTGTAYKTIEGETFKLTEGLIPSSAQPISNTTTLKYSVTDVTPATTTGYSIPANWPKVNGLANATTGGNDTVVKTAVAPSVQPALTSVFGEESTPTPGANQTFELKVTGVPAGKTVSYAVTAFFDVNGNNVYDEGNDPASATRTITWVDDADVLGTVSLTQPYVGDTTATASVVLDGYNQEQIAAHTVAIHFTDASGAALKGLTAASATAGNDLVVTTFASAKFSATTPSLTALVRPATASASGSVKATAYIRPAAAALATTFATNTAGTATVLATDAVKLGASFFAAEIRTYDSVTSSTALTANSLAASGTGDLAVVTRVNSEVKVTALLKKGADAQPNATISAKITTAVTLSATKTLTVNGKSYSANADLPTALALTSDADGKVYVTYSTAGFAVPEAVVIEFKGQGLTKTVTATPAALDYTIYETKNVLASNERSMDKGSSLKLGYKVVDQFKEPIATGHRLRLTATNSNGTPLTVSPAYFEGVLNSGATEFEVGNAAVGIYTATVVLQKYNSSTLLWDAMTANASPSNSDVNVEFTAPASININVIAVQKDVISATFATGEESEAVADAAEAANDVRGSRVASSTYTAGERATLGILVSEDITDIGRKGAEVTVSATGLLFGIAGGNYEVADTFKAYADASGVVSVDAISNIEGTYTITVTSGAATATAKVTFVSALPTASITWKNAPLQMNTQKTFEQTVITKDKYENLVGDAITFSNTGVGYFIISSVTTDEVTGEGTARFGNWLNEIGSSNLQATFTGATTVNSSIHTVEWGVTDSDVTVGGRAIYVSVEFAKNKTVTVTIDGKRLYSKIMTTDTYTELKFTQKKAGKHSVSVRIAGGGGFSGWVITTK